MNENKNYEIPEEELNRVSGGFIDADQEIMLNNGKCPLCGGGVQISGNDGRNYSCPNGHKYTRIASSWNIAR